MNKKITPNDFRLLILKENEVIVIPTNMAGRHGAGLARFANLKYGLKYGFDYGLFSKNIFCIPTKDKNIKTLIIEDIKLYVDKFLEYAKSEGVNQIFFVPEMGCGLAGYAPKDIAPLFKNVIDCNIENIYLPNSFWEILLNKIENYEK